MILFRFARGYKLISLILRRPRSIAAATLFLSPSPVAAAIDLARLRIRLQADLYEKKQADLRKEVPSLKANLISKKKIPRALTKLKWSQNYPQEILFIIKDKEGLRLAEGCLLCAFSNCRFKIRSQIKKSL